MNLNAYNYAVLPRHNVNAVRPLPRWQACQLYLYNSTRGNSFGENARADSFFGLDDHCLSVWD
jgi:hypothetical protein